MFTCKELGLNFYLPISAVDSNFEIADRPYTATKHKFYWRTNILEDGEPNIVELSIEEIFCGSPKHFYPGLNNLLEDFLGLQQTQLKSSEVERNEAREAF